MRYSASLAVGSLAAVALIAAVVSGASVPVSAETPVPTSGPITVVIPETSTPTPAPSSGTGAGSGSGGGVTGGGESGGESGNSGSDGTTCAGTNPDGSPIPPGQPKENVTELTVDKDRLAASEWIIATTDGLTKGEKAQVVLYPGAVVVGSYTVDAPEGFAARFRIPEGTLTGLHVLETTGWQSCFVANTEIMVVGAPLTSNVLTRSWVYGVLGVLFVGLLSLFIAFRRDISSWFSGSSEPESTR
jgi:hypothetical protein